MKRTCIALAAVFLMTGSARSEEHAETPSTASTKEIPYKDGDKSLTGFLARPKAEGTHPGVLIVHAWRGHSDNVRRVAREMAAKGYVAFALDMYGTGVYAKDNRAAFALATPFYKDPAMARRRATAGLQVLQSQPGVDKARIAAIGFCFGGTTVLELARGGTDIAGVVSFHGGLKSGMPAEKGAVKTKILVAHGGEDPYVPRDDFNGFWDEMKNAGADYQVLVLSGAVHSFTDPDAGDDPSNGAAYAPKAAARAWKATERFFAEIFTK